MKIVQTAAFAALFSVSMSHAAEKIAQYGSITVLQDGSKKIAVIDDSDTSAINIPEDFQVDSISFNREFSGEYNAPATVIFPFELKEFGCFSEFAQIFEIEKIQSFEWGDQITASIVNEKIKAHTPYFLRTHSKKFKIQEYCYPVTFKKTTSSQYETKFDTWHFIGTYGFRQWNEGNSELGRIYGFAAHSNEKVNEGRFVKGDAGIKIRPMRAYLKYDAFATSAKNRPAAGFLSKKEDVVISSPDSVVVIFKDGPGTTSIAKMSTVTGIMSTNGWFDLQGRRLTRKPTNKGTYFHNGNKVVIK